MIQLRLAATDFLIDARLFLPQNAGGCIEEQIARFIDADLPDAIKGETDRVRIGARRDLEVILETPLIAVIDEVDAGIDIAPREAAIAANARVPLFRIGADQVIRDAWQWFRGGDLARWLRSFRPHANRRCLSALRDRDICTLGCD